MGILQLHMMATPVKIFQLPTELVLVYETNFERRESSPMDVSPPPTCSEVASGED